MSEAFKTLVTAAICLVGVTWAIAWMVVTCNESNRRLESEMARNGYEQSSIPGQTGTYWVKKEGVQR